MTNQSRHEDAVRASAQDTASHKQQKLKYRKSLQAPVPVPPAPWLFQSLNYLHPPASLPLLSNNATLSLSSLSSLGSSPFFLDVKSLQSLLPLSSVTSRRPRSSFHPRQRLRNPAAGQHLARLDVGTPKRRKRSRAAEPRPVSVQRKYALRLDAIKAREKAGKADAVPHHIDRRQSRQQSSRRAAYYHPALEDEDHDKDDSDSAGPLYSMDEERQQKAAIAAQLGLTLDEYEYLDSAFGGQASKRKKSHDSQLTHRYREIFAQFDVDGSGSISPQELRSLLKAAGEDMDDKELASVIKQADTDQDGEIDMDEFIDLMRARKRLLTVANHMGVNGTGGLSIVTSGSSSIGTTTLNSSSSSSPLPPLKLASVQSKRHLQQFSPNFSRATPACLRPGAAVDLTQLRRELAISEFGIQELNNKVREGVQWVQQHCPVRSLKAQIFCHRWGMEKVQQLFLRLQSQSLSRAMQKWKVFRMYERNKLKAGLFLKCKGSQKMTEIMTRWRRKVTRRRLRQWKTECRADARNELNGAAIEIQRIMRGKIARLELIRRREARAAICMQALIRGHLARRLAAQLKQTKLEHDSACLLQRCYRGYTGKRIGRALFRAQREALAARRIQRCFRNFQQRELLRVIQRARIETHSAIQLQCCMRSFLAKKERNKRATYRRRERCALLIQRHARGFLARCSVLALRQQIAAALKIQSRYRVYRSRCRVQMMRTNRLVAMQRLRENAAATRIQTRWRCFRSRQLYLLECKHRQEAQVLDRFCRLTSAVIIQRLYRGYCARRRAQRLRYENLKWMNFTLMNASALKIQAFWRGYHGRLASHLRAQAQKALEHEQVLAAKRIQLAARGKLARGERIKRLELRKQANELDQKRGSAARNIQSVFRGKQARKLAIKLRQEHREQANQALDRLIRQTKNRAAIKIQCFVRRFLARVRYLHRKQEFERKKCQDEKRLRREHAAIEIQCALRRAKARRELVEKRHALERRISMMASEKAHDEIERLRKEQEEELQRLKLQLMFEQSKASDEAKRLRQQIEQQREDDETRHEEEAQELAKMHLQTLMQQQSQRRLMELERTQEAERLREKLELERETRLQMENLVRTQENEELTMLKMSTILETSAVKQNKGQESRALQDQAEQLKSAALAIHRDQARLMIQGACLKYVAKKRLSKLMTSQAAAMAAIQDEEQRLRLKAQQEQELVLARLKAVMDDEARAREQEIKALEMQMLERATREKERIARRNAAASQIQSRVRGFLGRRRVLAIQRKIEKEREDRAKALEASLADAEAKMEQALTAESSEAVVNVEDWVEYWDDNAQASYFYNIRTQEASWTRPISTPAAAAEGDQAALIVDYEDDSYASTQVDENGYSVNGESYADEYGYYDAYGQYHYYEEEASQAQNAGYAGMQQPMVANGGYPMQPGAFPDYAAAYAYQNAMAYGAAMMFATPMGYGSVPMMQPMMNPMMMPMAAQATVSAPATAVVATAATAAPPDPWEKFFDQYTGAAYYYNSLTGERYWA